jgi:membrane-associated protease RseP (regulator of RpoE activity)
MLLSLFLLLLQSPGEPKPAVVPFEIIGSKHMAVQIKINGKGPYRVIFDTGAPISLLSSKAATEAGLIKKASSNAFMGMNGMSTVKDFQVGDVQAKDIQVIVMDHPTVKAISEVVGPIEGIVGFPFFAKFKTTVNYKDKTMTMTPTKYEPGDVMASLMTTMMAGSKERKLHLSPTTVWGVAVGKEKEDEEDGVEVVHLYPGSPAEKAGVKVGDRLLVIDGTWSDSIEDVYRAVSQVKAGRTIEVKVRRDGKEQVLKVETKAGL